MQLNEGSFALFDHPVRGVNFDLFQYAMSSMNGFDMSTMETLIMGGSLGPLQDTPRTSYEDSDAHTSAANEFYQMIQVKLNDLFRKSLTFYTILTSWL